MPITTAMAGDDCSKVDSCSYSSLWSSFSRLTVTYSSSKGGKGTTFDYYVKDGESLTTFDTETGKATMFSIPGVATLWRGVGITGIKPWRACYEYIGDTHSLVDSYAVRLLFFLGFGVKGGPEIVSDSVNIDVANKEDTKVQITPSDSLTIRGPWSLKGNVKRGDEITFDFSHNSKAFSHSASLFLVGTWQNNPVELPIETTQSLNEWLVCLFDKPSNKAGKSESASAVEDASDFKTIEDLKARALRSSGVAQKHAAH